MLYTLRLLLGIFLLIQLLRNLYLLWNFRPFLPRIPMHPLSWVSLTGENWANALVSPSHYLACAGLMRTPIGLPSHSSRWRAVWSPPLLGWCWWELVTGMTHAATGPPCLSALECSTDNWGRGSSMQRSWVKADTVGWFPRLRSWGPFLYEFVFCLPIIGWSCPTPTSHRSFYVPISFYVPTSLGTR